MYLLLRVICAFAVGGQRWDALVGLGQEGHSWKLHSGGRALTHGALPHQTDELMRPRLSRHPQEDFSEWVVGKPARLGGKKTLSIFMKKKRESRYIYCHQRVETFEDFVIYKAVPECVSIFALQSALLIITEVNDQTRILLVHINVIILKNII